MTGKSERQLYTQKENCCGCAACMNVCPCNAITMTEDEDGYFFPQINQKLCVNCGLCNKVCYYQKGCKKVFPLEVKAAYANQENILFKSSSGGIFPILSEKILNENGCVYGAAYKRTTSQLEVIHKRIDNIENLHLLQGSKYAQSIIGDAYQQVKNDLESGKIVLFSGTPCQVGGLKGFLNKDYDTLFTIDVICHGVPNLQQFNEYIQYLEEKYRGTILDFSFRDKSIGWEDFYINALLKKHKKIKNKNAHCRTQAYYDLFLNSVIYRESCYSCPYACGERIGDITLGDYWGIEQAHPDLAKNPLWSDKLDKGISCVLLNTEKGIKLYYSVINNIVSENSTFEKASRKNGQLKQPSSKSSSRTLILNIWKKEGYGKIQSIYKRKKGAYYYYFFIKKWISCKLKKLNVV